MRVFTSLGAAVRERVLRAGYVVSLLLHTLRLLPRLPRRLRFFLDACHSAGVRALPVTMIVAMFAGMILALQTGIELRAYGQTTAIGTITALSMCREMGPFITAVILAATVGSAMAAELGTMNVSDEVTALEVMSVDPADFLVLPRVAALTVMCPAVTVFSNLLGIAGGSVVADFQLGISGTFYWNSVERALTDTTHLLPKDVYVGLLKAMVFGCLVSAISCAAGLRAQGGALGVGSAVQSAVRNSVVMIIVAGYVITAFFYSR
jgi:phospholipid/cholesterol/gamma-HCH transport system permease protein